jgi:hypothetical protein
LSKIKGLALRQESDDEWAFEVDWLVSANVLDPRSGVLVERVEAEAVFGRIDDLQKTIAEEHPIGSADKAFEDGLLDPLSIILTGARGLPKASAAGGGCR